MKEFDIGYPHSAVKRVVPEGFRTIKNRLKAFHLDREYYDGARENGYGGFHYDGRWKSVIPRLISRYDLASGSAVLDVGCKKGFFLHDLKESLPGVRVAGVENHSYPIENGMELVKPYMKLAEYDGLPFPAKEFDFVMAFASIYMLNLRGVMGALREIQRVGKGNSYVTLGAYRTPEGKELLEEWTLLGTTVLHVNEWIEVFRETGYTGDYYFTTAESLHLTRG